MIDPRARSEVALIAVALLVACGSTLDDGVQFGTGDSGAADATASAGDDTGSPSGGSTNADGTSSMDESAGADDTGGVKYDVGAGTETGGEPDGCECGSQLGFSYIWVANSAHGTVSKINTTTLEEEGRYITRPDGVGDPSRTSVSLDGLAVAVANRSGGVVKIWSSPSSCDAMANGVAGLQTSTGKDDVLPWGEDDCIAWYTAFDGYGSQRPIAWAPGVQDPETCVHHDQKVWTAGSGPTAFVHLLNGDDGTIEHTIDNAGPAPGMFGQYGGAVDSEGNFWITRNGISPGDALPDLVRVDRDDFSVTPFDFPQGVAGYGITVDSSDRVWISSNGYGIGVARFDPADGSWLTGAGGFTSFSGVVESGDHRIWTGSSEGVLWSFAGDSLANGDSIALDGMIKGVSVDVDGHVWAITVTTAYKIDPTTMDIVGSYAGLDGPYTYSDMTGWALQNAACEPAG
jgi:hypothetical protein